MGSISPVFSLLKLGKLSCFFFGFFYSVVFSIANVNKSGQKPSWRKFASITVNYVINGPKECQTPDISVRKRLAIDDERV